MLLITREIPEAVAMRAAREHPQIRQLGITGLFDPALVLANVAGVAAILCTPADRFDAALIGALPASVKVIATYSVGLEHIDQQAAAARGIVICNTPDVLSTATAELALTLMLMAARRAARVNVCCARGDGRGFRPHSISAMAWRARCSAFSAWDGLGANWPPWRANISRK